MLLFDNRYECKLSTRAIFQIEKALGDNPLNLIYNDSGIPKLTVMLNILFYSARKENPQIRTIDDMIDIYDEYVENGGSLTSLAQFVVDLIEDSGMVNKKEEESTGDTEERKN